MIIEGAANYNSENYTMIKIRMKRNKHTNETIEFGYQRLQLYMRIMDVFFPAFLEIPGFDTLPVPEVNFPGPRPTLEAKESPPLSERKLIN